MIYDPCLVFDSNVNICVRYYPYIIFINIISLIDGTINKLLLNSYFPHHLSLIIKA